MFCHLVLSCSISSCLSVSPLSPPFHSRNFLRASVSVATATAVVAVAVAVAIAVTPTITIAIAIAIAIDAAIVSAAFGTLPTKRALDFYWARGVGIWGWAAKIHL